MFTNSLSKATYAAMLAAGISLCSGASADSYESLHRYCESSWQRAGIPRQDWKDCTHDTIVELLVDSDKKKAASCTEDRNLKRCVWRVAKRWQREKRACQLDICDPSVISTHENTDENSAVADASHDEKLYQAMSQLSAQQREVIQRWSAGQTIKQIANDLRTSSGKVSNQKYKALKKIEQLLGESGSSQTSVS
jgi:RNA polymerase sigma factor (sigma-70 family)